MPQINFSCPDDLKDRLTAYAKSKYTSEASIVRQCLVVCGLCHSVLLWADMALELTN
jgi:hypothetical protein